MSATSHPGDALSALVDGELSPPDAASVNAHVASCGPCAEELAAVREARAAVRSLPAVEPPAGFLHSLLAGPGDEGDDEAPIAPVVAMAARRRVASGAVAAAVAGLLVLVASGPGGIGAIAPELGGAVQRHAATVSAVSDRGPTPGAMLPMGAVTPSTAVPRSPDALPAPFSAPEELAGYRLVGAFQAPGGVHLLYERGRFGLSLFEQEGGLDMADLPEPGTRFRLDGADAWRWDHPVAAGRVIVVARGGLVVTLVGDESADAVLAAARALPGPTRHGLLTRLERASAGALDALSPVG